MSQHPRRPGSHVLSLAAVLTAIGLVTGSGLPATTAASPAPSIGTSPAKPLLLINGDRLMVSSAIGRVAIAVRSATQHDDYLCVAKSGYDAPTGLGTPNGIGAF